MAWLFTVWLTAACPLLAQAPSPSLKQADADYRAGVVALTHNNLKTARRLFQQVVTLAPTAEQGHSALGAVMVRTGNLREGIAELERALALDPADATAQLNLANAYEQAGEPAKSLPWFRKLVAASQHDRRPVAATIDAAYARSLAATGQFSTAVEQMQAAVAQQPNNAEWQDELGSIEALAKNWPAAVQAFHAALIDDPDLAMAHLHLGLALEAQHQSGSLEALRDAWRLAPHSGLIAAELGRALAANGKDAEAVPVLRQALTLNPNSIAATYQLALALQRTDHVADATPLLERVVAAQPDNAEALTNLGLALSQQQQAIKAVPILQRAVALTPHNPTARQNLAAAYIQLNQFDDAVRQLQQALRFAPNDPALHYNLGIAYKMQDDSALAIPELETAGRLNPAGAEAPYSLGVLYLQAGRYADAEGELSRSVAIQPHNADAWATLGSVENHLDKLPEAVVALRRSIEQLPDQADVHLTLAAVLVKQHLPAEAKAERAIAAGLMRDEANRKREALAQPSHP